jgi:hypothetical protein
MGEKGLIQSSCDLNRAGATWPSTPTIFILTIFSAPLVTAASTQRPTALVWMGGFSGKYRSILSIGTPANVDRESSSFLHVKISIKAKLGFYHIFIEKFVKQTQMGSY